jgi:hypothetical protein
LTGPSKNDVPESIGVLYIGAGASKLIRYPVSLKAPLSHLQKGSKTSCDEIQHLDIFPQRDIIYGRPNSEEVKIHYVDVQKMMLCDLM